MAGAAALSQRLFIALPCPLTPAIQQAITTLHAIQQEPAAGVRVVNAGSLHITLAFLGSVASMRLADVQAAMDCLRALGSTQLSIRGSSWFPGVLWLGVETNAALTELKQRCGDAMHSLGFAMDERAFHPHVTIARLQAAPGFDYKAWARAHGDRQWATYEANAVHLYRSNTQGSSPGYEVIHTVALR